jgi:TRAP-type C4-dicarboxylate transport system permease small subunit
VAAFGVDKIARLLGTSVSGLPGYEDFVRLAVSAVGLMVMPYCQLRRGHIAVDLLANVMSRPVRKALDTASLLAIVGLTLFLAYWMVLGMQETRSDGALSRVLGWPEWPFYVPGIVSLVLWAAVAALQAFGGRHERA